MIKVYIGRQRDTDYVIHNGRHVSVCPQILFSKTMDHSPIRAHIGQVTGELNLLHKADGGYAYKILLSEGLYKGFSKTLAPGEFIEIEEKDFTKQFYAFYYDETDRDHWRCAVETLEDAWLFSKQALEGSD